MFLRKLQRLLLITKNTQTLGRNGIKGLDRSPPQELKEGQRSGSHLLVEVKEEDEKIEVKKKNNDNDNVLKSENKQDVSVEHEDPTKHEEEKKYKGNFQMTFIQTCF